MSDSGAYYNEIDPKAAAWLRELVKRGHIADGVVDERSIVDVAPDDLRGFTQCHFFAGIGVWSYALRRAGWADDRPVWTGSCPCQPFSAAGARGGVADERHLWPHWHHLISQCRPPVVFGEQVASKDGLGWLDLVQADLEGSGYASGAADLCAAGVGAPHIRQRLWFVGVADAADAGLQIGRGGSGGELGSVEQSERLRADGGPADADRDGSQGRLSGWSDAGREAVHGSAGRDGTIDNMEHAQGDGRVERRAEPSGRGLAGGRGDGGLGNTSGTAGQRDAGTLSGAEAREHGAGQSVDGREPVGSEHASASVGGLADADGVGAERGAGNDAETARLQEGQREPIDGADVLERGGADHDGCGNVRVDGVFSDTGRPGPTNGHWRDADWLFCRDGKWRPVEPGTFPLAHGSAARVGRLRGYGNAIAAPAAQAFIESVMEISNA